MPDVMDDYIFIVSNVLYNDGSLDRSIDYMIKELESRGFDYICHVKDQTIVTFALKLTILLQAKLRLQVDTTLYLGDSTHELESKESSYGARFAQLAFKILLRIPFMKETKDKKKVVFQPIVYVAHDDFIIESIVSKSRLYFRNELSFFKKSNSINLDRICSYFDAKIAIYFGFLEFYTKLLIIPSIFGFLLLLNDIYMYYTKSSVSFIDYTSIPLFCIITSLWGSIFLEYWKRQYNTLVYKWRNSFDAESTILFSGPKLSSTTLRQAISTIICLTAIGFIIALMMYFNAWQIDARLKYDTYDFNRYVPVILYSICPVFSGILFTPLAKKLTHFERHLSASDYHMHYIIKIFALQFVNRYSALIYAVFWMKDLSLLKSLLTSLLVTNAIINNIMEVGIPFVTTLWKTQTLENSANNKSFDIMLSKDLIECLTNKNSHLHNLVKLSNQVDENIHNNKGTIKAKLKIISSKPKKFMKSMLSTFGFGKNKSKDKSKNRSDTIVSTTDNEISSKNNQSQWDDKNSVSSVSESKDFTPSMNSSPSKPIRSMKPIILNSTLHPTTSVKTVDISKSTKIVSGKDALSMTDDGYDSNKLSESINSHKKQSIESDRVKLEKYWKHKLLREISLSEYDIDEDYLELVLQYGYLTMFVAGFHMAPLLALINNIFEATIDLTKLQHCKRQKSTDSPALGPWTVCLEFINFFAVITNCYILCIVSHRLDWLWNLLNQWFTKSSSSTSMISDSITSITIHPEVMKFIGMIVLEHILIAVKLLCMGVIEDVPVSIQEQQLKDKRHEEHKNFKTWLRLHALENIVSRNSDEILHNILHPTHITSNTSPKTISTNAIPNETSTGLPSLSKKDRLSIVTNLPTSSTSSTTIMTKTTTELPKTSPTRLGNMIGSNLIQHTSSTRTHSPMGRSIVNTDYDHFNNSNITTTNDDDTMPSMSSVSSSYDLAKALMESAFQNSYPTKQILLHHLYPDRYEFLGTHESLSIHKVGHRSISSNKNNIQKSNRLFATSSFGFNPMTILVVIFIPLILLHFEVSLYLYIPIALFIFCYLQGLKDMDDRRIALNITADVEMSHILGYLTSTNYENYLPSFIQDSSYERVEWCNSIMSKLWPSIAHALELKAMRKFDEMTEKYKPPIVSYIKLDRVFFGDIPPKMLGVRILDTSENLVRMDWEVRYSGNPDIVLKIGTLPLPTTLAVGEMRMSFKARVEFLNFIPKIPPFGAMSVSFLELPSIDFSFLVAGVDVMSLGPKDVGVAKIVKNVINSAIKQEALYPNKILIAVDSSTEHIDTSLPPQGIVTILIERANQLKISETTASLLKVDMVNSDPYVQVQCLDQIYKTSIKHLTLNPVFNESFDFIIYDKTLQTIEMTVYDSDIAKSDETLGHTNLDLKNIIPLRSIRIEKKLEDAKSGTIIFTANYIPLLSKGSSNSITKTFDRVDENTRISEKDVLYQVSLEDLIHNDILPDLPIPNANVIPRNSIGSHTVTNTIGVLIISSIKCRNIRTTPSQGSKAIQSPYINLELGGDIRSTRVQKKSYGDPIFNETFNFVVREPMTKSVILRVKEKSLFHQDKVIGELILSLEHIIHGTSMPLEQEYPLNGEVECYVYFKLQWAGSY